MNLDIDISDLDKQFNDGVNQIEQVVITHAVRAGEIYAATAKAKGSYTDQTGNLRVANGYEILKNGKSILSVSGRTETSQGAQKFAGIASIVGVYGNGMEYASAVEARGKDVVSSGFLEAENFLKKQLR